MKKYFLVFIIIILTIFKVQLYAEETVQERHFGITASASPDYSTAGFIYNFTKYTAIRPVLGFYQVDNSVREYSVLADFLFFSREEKSFSFYFGAGLGAAYSYGYYKYTDGDRSRNTSYSYNISVLAGGQYMLSERFGFFADTGIQAGWRKTKQENYDSATTENINISNHNIIIRLRSASIGALFYFF